jgi:signal transduction histidine kinase
LESDSLSHGRSSVWRADGLQWAMGCFCASVGAFVLVAPHRFAADPYETLTPFRTWWGLAALAGGSGLLAAAILRPRRAASVPVHFLAGLTLFALAWIVGLRSAWMGTIFYTCLGAGVLAAGLLPTRDSPLPAGAERDLFAMAMGTAALASGAAMELFPGLFSRPAVTGNPWRPLLEVGLLAAGALLCAVVPWAAPRWLARTAHLAAGAVFALWGGLVALPAQAWTGVVLFLGGGAMLAVSPWLSRRLASVDASSLRTRLAFALAVATSVALILTTAVATSEEENLATRQVVDSRKVEAESIARIVSDYTSLNAAHASVLAAMAGRVAMEPVAQSFFLTQALPFDPGITGLLCLDPRGTVVAAAGRIPLDTVDWREVAAGVRQDRPVAAQLLSLEPGGPPYLVLSAPVVALDGALSGVLVAAVDSSSLAERIVRPGSNVYLGDGHGRLIAHQEGVDPASAGAPWPADWDRQLAAGRRPGLIRRLAAFARVPNLGWWVGVERPPSAALAGVRRGRDLAFVLLLIVVPVAVTGGIVTARRISRPLDTLAAAVDEMTAGNPRAPLDDSSIGEVARLSSAFAAMRESLAARTQELAASDRRKGEFLAMLAHELRNPLNAITTAVGVLEEPGVPQDLAGHAVTVIQRQIQHLVRLVDDLLDVSRIAHGKVELRRERIDLADVVRHAVDAFHPLLEAKRQTLSVGLPQEPLPLDADPTRLEQVLGNLLGNAVKFSGSGGRIGVDVRRDGAEVTLAVSDDGPGIPPDLLPRIFDLYTQGPEGIDRAGAGLGIGLTLVRRLVELHGGRVEAQSEGEGTGCTLVVHLPLAATSVAMEA